MRVQYRTGILLLFAAITCAGATEDAIAAYKGADYNRAIPLLQTAVAASPQDAVLNAALLSALVYEGRLDDASELADNAAAAFPQSPEVTAARGEEAVRQGRPRGRRGRQRDARRQITLITFVEQRPVGERQTRHGRPHVNPVSCPGFMV